MKNKEHKELTTLSLISALIDPVFYLFKFFVVPAYTSIALGASDNSDFWVEGFFELFVTVMVAVTFYQLGMVSTRQPPGLTTDAILFPGVAVGAAQAITGIRRGNPP